MPKLLSRFRKNREGGEMNSYLIIIISMFGGIATMWIASEIIRKIKKKELKKLRE